MNKSSALVIALGLSVPAVSSWGITLESLDQSYIVPQISSWQGYVIYQGLEKAQTLTVGESGWLRRVDLQVTSDCGYPRDPSLLTDPLILSIHYVLSSGEPIATAQRSFSISPEEIDTRVPNIVSVDLSAAPLLVFQGQRLALVLSSDLPAPSSPSGPPDADYAFITLPEDGYAAGTGWRRSIYYTNNQWVQEDFDFGFQTYVSPIPEPTALSLLTVASLALAMVRRRRQGRWASQPFRVT